MQQHILRDDGRYLTGPGATQTDDKPGSPFASLAAAMAAIDRYRIVAAVYCPDRKADGFTLLSAKP